MQTNIVRHTAPSVSKLEELFATFNQVSVDLGSRYRELEARVADLSTELALSHSARLKELTAKEQLAAKLGSLMDTLPGGVIVIDASGTVREENAIAQRLLGTSVVNRNWKDIIKAASGSNSLHAGEVSLQNGLRLCLSSSAYGDAGDKVVLLTDITEDFRLRNLVNREERLAALGEMSARLAHQVRTPLSTAILYLSHLPTSDNQQSALVVKKILERLRQIESLTDGMLSYIRGETRAHRVFSLTSVLKEVSETNILLMKKSSGQLTLDAPADNCLIEGDKEAIVNALNNLIENAVQATHETPRIVVSLQRVDSNYQITVSDNGPGIEESIKEKIFDPFFSGRPDGTGLGLAVVMSAVRAFSGQISIKNRKQGGARIEILLPVNSLPPKSSTGIWNTTEKMQDKNLSCLEYAHE